MALRRHDSCVVRTSGEERAEVSNVRKGSIVLKNSPGRDERIFSSPQARSRIEDVGDHQAALLSSELPPESHYYRFKRKPASSRRLFSFFGLPIFPSFSTQSVISGGLGVDTLQSAFPLKADL